MALIRFVTNPSLVSVESTVVAHIVAVVGKITDQADIELSSGPFSEFLQN
jgi:hypothetical protein